MNVAYLRSMRLGVALALLLVVSVGAARAEERASAQQDGPAVGVLTKGENAVVACYVRSEVAPELQDLLGKLTDRTWTMLEEEDWDGLWALSHADDANLSSKDMFVAGLTSAAERLGRPVEDSVDELFVFRFTGEFAGPATCGSTALQDPNHVVVQVSSKAEPLALVLRRSKQPPFDRIITFVFRGVDKSWRFAGLIGSDVAFLGKGARDYANSAEQYGAAGDHLAQLAALEIAHAFSKTAPFIERSASYEIARKLKALIGDSNRFDTVRNMKVGSHDYVIREVTIETTRTGIRPRLVYLSRYPIDDPEGAEEARELAAHIAQHYPATAKAFHSVLLEALATSGAAGGKPASKRYLETLVR